MPQVCFSKMFKQIQTPFVKYSFTFPYRSLYSTVSFSSLKTFLKRDFQAKSPSVQGAIHQALEALHVGHNDLLYDLGCGDGRLLLAAAQRGAKALGVEYDTRFVEKALAKIEEFGVSHLAKVICGDAFETDLTPASKIFVYLVPDGLRKIEPSLCAAMKRGTPIASYMFSIPGWSADDVLTAETRAAECKVWIYQSPKCLPP